MSSDEYFSLRLSDSDSENQTQQKNCIKCYIQCGKNVKQFNRKPAQVSIKSVKNCPKELVRNPVYTHTSPGLCTLKNTEVHNKKSANNQLASPAKREIQLNVSPQCLSKKDDAKRTDGSPQNQLSTEICESEEHEVIRLERPVKNLTTITNKGYLADNVCKNISEISNVDSQKSDQLNSSSNSSKEYAIFNSTKKSDSSEEFFGFNNPVQSFFPKDVDNKRQDLKNTVTVSSGKNLSINRKSVPRNFKSSKKAEKKLTLSPSTDSSERSSKRNVRTNNNYVSSSFESVKKKNENFSEINNSSQSRYPLRSNRIESLDSAEKSSDSSEKSSESCEKSSDSSEKSSESCEKSSKSSEKSSDYNKKSSNIKKSYVSSEELLDSSTKLVRFQKSFHIDEISYLKKHNEVFLSSSSSDTSTECLASKTTWSQRNLTTNQNNVSSDFEPSRKKKKIIPLNCTSSDSSTEFFGFVKITSTPKNHILKRRYYEPSSSDESDDSSPNDRNRFIIRHNKKNKRRKLIRKISSSDSEDTSFTNPSKSSSRSKSESSSTDDNYSRSVYTAKKDIKVSRRSKEEKIKKLRNYFMNVNVDLRREKYFWRDCQLNVDKVLKWIKNQKNINKLIENPRTLQWEIEAYLEHLELNTRSIISLNKRVTRSQTATQRWQHFLKYGNTVKYGPFKSC